MEAMRTATTNRSLRTIRSELDFLAETSILTPQQVASILAELPPATTTSPLPAFTPPPTAHPPPNTRLPTTTTISPPEKQNGYYAPPSSTLAAISQPPPAYAPSTPTTPLVHHQPTPQPLATAKAIYAYAPTDAGDLALAPHDTVRVTEWMNADWAKGRNERSGAEGIFPRSYVQVMDGGVDGKEGNEVAGQGGGVGQQQQQQQGGSKMNEQGKKFGKKMGNAAIFGAGATIGSNIVNSIF